MKKRCFCFVLVVILSLMICSFSVTLADTDGKSNAADYYSVILKGGTWSNSGYNYTYQKNSLDVIPDYIRWSSGTFTAYDCQVFGDESGEVWAIIKDEVYRLWLTSNGNIVLTGTTEGLGWSGYSVYSPSNK